MNDFISFLAHVRLPNPNLILMNSKIMTIFRIIDDVADDNDDSGFGAFLHMQF